MYVWLIDIVFGAGIRLRYQAQFVAAIDKNSHTFSSNRYYYYPFVQTRTFSCLHFSPHSRPPWIWKSKKVSTVRRNDNSRTNFILLDNVFQSCTYLPYCFSVISIYLTISVFKGGTHFTCSCISLMCQKSCLEPR